MQQLENNNNFRIVCDGRHKYCGGIEDESFNILVKDNTRDVKIPSNFDPVKLPKNLPYFYVIVFFAEFCIKKLQS